MKCIKCGKPLSMNQIFVHISNGENSCYNCFYDGIPNTTSRMESDYEKSRAARIQAINNRIQEFKQLIKEQKQ